jgi:prepilin-type N-terminal cleavage/methylation domain-containing protein
MNRRDCGFTLVELLVVIAILGIITPVMASAFIIGFRTTASATSQLAASHNRQMLAAFFTEDAQSTTAVVDSTSTDVTTCMLAGETLVSRLSWTDRDASGTATARVVTYVLVSVGTDRQLVRHSCVNSVRSDVVLVHNAVASSIACLSAAYAVVPCASSQVVRLTASDSTGPFDVTGMRRS